MVRRGAVSSKGMYVPGEKADCGSRGGAERVRLDVLSQQQAEMLPVTTGPGPLQPVDQREGSLRVREDDTVGGSASVRVSL